MSPKADSIVSFFGNLFLDEPLPKDGYVELPHDKPGFGVTLNREGLNMTRPYRRSESANLTVQQKLAQGIFKTN